MDANDRPREIDGREVDDGERRDGDVDERALVHAITLATESVAGGGGPFGAVVVHDGAIVASGQNRVTLDLDPSAHAEIVAIRSACAMLGRFSLAGCTLYSSCEPCPMCLASALWARLDTVVFAADRHDAARGGFDDGAFYDLLEQDRDTWTTPTVDHRRVAGSTAPFDAWLEHAARTDY